MSSRPQPRRCRDCGAGSHRPAPHPGPRCATHHREIRQLRKQRTHDLYVQNTYGLKAGEYEALYQFQGCRCYICPNQGKRRKLSVDHDHGCCPNLPACGRCVRGLVCGSCNTIIGRLRDDPEAFDRAADYLRSPPLARMRSG